MFDHVDGIIGAVARTQPQSKDDMFFAMKFAQQLLSKSHAEVTPIMGMLLKSAHILDLFPTLRLLTTYEKGMDIHSQNNALYNTQYQEAILKYVENKYCA